MNVNTMILAGRVSRKPEVQGDQVALVINAAEFKKDVFHPRGGTWEANYIQVRVLGSSGERAEKLKQDEYVALEGSVGQHRWEVRDQSGQIQKRSTTIMRAYRVKPLGDTSLTMNQVVLQGRLGAPPDVKYFNTGGAITNFSLASSEWNKDIEAEETVWTQVRILGKRAVPAAEVLEKGSQVIVTGSMITDSWVDKQGQRQHRTFIRTFGYNVIGAKRAPVAAGYGEPLFKEESSFEFEDEEVIL